MHVWKMVVAVGVIALAVAGCGSDDEGPTADKGEQVLKVGESFTAPMNTTSAATGEITKVEVATTAVVKGAIADLSDFEIDAKFKASEPYYVTMKFRNVGDKPAFFGGIYTRIRAYSADQDELTELTLSERALGGRADFAKCPGADTPDPLEVGAEFTNCTIYLAPSGQALDKVLLQYSAGSGGSNLEYGDIAWKAS